MWWQISLFFGAVPPRGNCDLALEVSALSFCRFRSKIDVFRVAKNISGLTFSN